MAKPTGDGGRGGSLLARRGQDGLIHQTDLVVTLVVLAVCAFFYYVTSTFDEVSALLSQNIPPEFFPRGVLIIIMILALGLPFEHVFHRRRGEDIDSDRSERVKRLPYLTTILLLLIIFAMPYVGTLISTVAICLMLPVLWGERRWHAIVPFAVLFPLAVAYLFDRVLLVQFDPGMIGIAP